jgi:hypothetical protein
MKDNPFTIFHALGKFLYNNGEGEYVKELILKTALDNDWTLFFEHDPTIECIKLERTEKGIRAKNNFLLSSL